MIACQPNQFGIRVAHNPASSLRTALSRIEDLLPKEQQTNAVYCIPCANCPRVYVGHTGRHLSTRTDEHKLAVRRREPLSLVFAHALACNHRCNWNGTEVVAMTNTKRARGFLETWYSNAGGINRHSDLDVHYEGLLVLDTAAIMPDLAGLDDVTNCISPRVTTRGSRSGRLNPFPSPTTETEYRRSKNHLHVLTNCVEPGFELISSSKLPMWHRYRIEGSNTELLRWTTKNMPEPPQSPFLDDLIYPCDVVAASADCLI
nr:unnamed protein product [Spirometra erinaceieuropaei]